MSIARLNLSLLILIIIISIEGKHGGSSTPTVWKPILSPDVKEDLQQKVHIDAERIRHNFSNLQTMIRKSIKTNTDHKDLAAHVAGMSMLTKEDKKQVADAFTVDDIFIILTDYWSMLDFNNLENIAQHFCHDAVKQEMKQYKDDVRRFCERRVSEFPHGSLSNGTDNEGRDKLVVILDLKDPPLKHILRIKEVIANILEKPASKLVLCDISPGSVIVTFWIATSLGEKLLKSSDVEILTQKQKNKLLEADVVLMKFKGIIVFSIHQEIKGRKSGIAIMTIVAPGSWVLSRVCIAKWGFQTEISYYLDMHACA